MGRPKGSKNKKKSKGLGDTIEKVTEATGIKKVVKAVLGDDCGCEERKEKLNKLFPRKRKIKNCLTDEQIEWYKDYKERRTLSANKIVNEDIIWIEKIYAHLYNFSSYRICRSCGSSGREILKILETIDTIIEEGNKIE